MWSNEFLPYLPHNTVYRMIPNLENFECQYLNFSIESYAKQQYKKGGVQIRNCTPLLGDRGVDLSPCTPLFTSLVICFLITICLRNSYRRNCSGNQSVFTRCIYLFLIMGKDLPGLSFVLTKIDELNS